MNQEEIRAAAKVMQAFADGKVIQYRHRFKQNSWTSASMSAFEVLGWDFINYEYRIKPEPPKPRSFWIVEWASSSSSTWTRVRVCPNWESAQHTLSSCWNRNADPRRVYRAVELREVLP